MSKYGNKKCTYQGIRFDSEMEKEYFKKLQHDKLVGDVIDFSLQPSFTVLDAYILNGEKKRGVKYVSDFKVTYRDGSEVIIDIKGVETDVFIIKRKLYESRYGEQLPLIVVCKDDNGNWINVYDKKKKDGKSNVKRTTNKRRLQKATRNTKRVR